jgi:hypothetical protein
VRARTYALPVKKSSVQQDWRAWLPSEKAEVFGQQVRRLECFYGMFSVALNDAIELRQTGKWARSCQAVGVLPPLCLRLAHPLGALLRSLGEHAKHYGIIPNTAPLDPANFQGYREQRTAKKSDLLSRVLLSQRSQFLHKISTLEEMVVDVGKHFRQAAEHLGAGASAEPFEEWQTVDAAHYDLNTCLRETIVLLKSFLLVLPDEELAAFQKTVDFQMRESHDPSGPGRYTRHRRMVPIEGE